LAYLVVRAVKRKHMPDDTVSKIELHRQLNSVGMKKGEDPAVLGTQIASIKVRFNTPEQAMDETEFIAVVISQAPVLYTGVLTYVRTAEARKCPQATPYLCCNGYAVVCDGTSWHQERFERRRRDRAHIISRSVLHSYATRRGIGHTNVPTRRQTEMETVITAKEIARQRVAMVLIVGIAAKNPIMWKSSAGESPVTSISSSLIGSRRKNK
jgi:hypothetical protein